MVLADPVANWVFLSYSVLYLVNAGYCAYESVYLLTGPCNRSDFSSGSSQRGFFFLLFLFANLTRAVWIMLYSLTDAIDDDETFPLIHFLRSIPELLFLAAYSFLGAYLGQFKASSSGSATSWLYHTVAIRSISMILLFGCLALSTLGGVSPLLVYAFLVLLYLLTIVSITWNCYTVYTNLQASVSSKAKITGRLLPLLIIALFSLVGGAMLNIIACIKHWPLGFSHSHEMIFGFFYFFFFEGMPSTAILIVLYRGKAPSSTAKLSSASARSNTQYSRGAYSSAANATANDTTRLLQPSSDQSMYKRLDYNT